MEVNRLVVASVYQGACRDGDSAANLTTMQVYLNACAAAYRTAGKPLHLAKAITMCHGASNHPHRKNIVKRFCPCVQSCIGWRVPSIRRTGKEMRRAQRVPWTIRWLDRDLVTGTANPTLKRTHPTRGG
jgi:hypothetical protein